MPLTAGRSLAVDQRYIPLGAPVWLETTAPWPEGEAPLRRLMVAQDTGGAIKGAGPRRRLLGRGRARRGDRRPHAQPGPLRGAPAQGGDPDQLSRDRADARRRPAFARRVAPIG